MNNDRLHFIDNLRAFMIVLVILLHAALCYMAYAPQWWYVLDEQRSFALTIVVLGIDVFIMPVMFFCAGYFTLPSLRKKGASRFWRDKQNRLVLPWIAGVLIMTPPLIYLTIFRRFVPGATFSEFWMGPLWGDFYQQAHFWFLGILLFFYLLTVGLSAIAPQFMVKRARASRPGMALSIGFLLFTTLAALAMNCLFPLDYWFNKTYILSFQPVRIIGLFAYFMLGIYAEKNAWFSAEGYQPRLLGWTLLALFSSFFYLFYRVSIPEHTQVTLLLKGGNALAFNLFCFTIFMALLAFFQRFFNRGSRLARTFSACSYASYYVHMYFVLGCAYLLLPLSLPVLVKFTIVSIVAVLCSWGTAMLMKKAPVTRGMF